MQGTQSNHFAPLSTKYSASAGVQCPPSWKNVKLGLFNPKTSAVFPLLLPLLIFSSLICIIFFPSVLINNGHVSFSTPGPSPIGPPKPTDHSNS